MSGSDHLQRLTEAPLGRLELPNRQQERPRNVAQVRRKAQGGEPVKNGLNTGIAGILRNGKIECFVVDNKGAWPI